MYKQTHSKISLILVFLAILFCNSVVLANTITTIINGQNNQAIDRIAIQNAVDSAKPGSIVVLNGVFQLDGTVIDIKNSSIVLKGAGENDGWSTVLVGLTNPNGSPQLDKPAPTFQHFNRAFKISHDARNITIMGIKFLNINRGITISPGLQGNSNLCSDITVTKGGANYIVRDNWFDNNSSAFNVIGEADGTVFTHNKMTNTLVRDISFGGGGALRCAMPNGTGGFITVVIPNAGVPKNAVVSDNVIDQDKAQFSVAYLQVINLLMIGNKIDVGPNSIGAVTLRTDNAFILNNAINLNGFGFFGVAVDPATAPTVFNNPKNTVAFNFVSNSIADVGVGIVVDSTSGATMFGNTFSNNAGADYLLCDLFADTNNVSSAICDGLGIPTSNNKIIVDDPSITVMDLGVDNKIINKFN